VVLGAEGVDLESRKACGGSLQFEEEGGRWGCLAGAPQAWI
jgi:hypothetical protein